MWATIHGPALYLILPLLINPQVVSNCLAPHGQKHTRLLCPSLSFRVCSNSCPLSQWCYLTISSSAVLFSSCLQSFQTSGSFPMSRLFASGGRSSGASAIVLPMNIQGWLLLGLTIIDRTKLASGIRHRLRLEVMAGTISCQPLLAWQGKPQKPWKVW